MKIVKKLFVSGEFWRGRWATKQNKQQTKEQNRHPCEGKKAKYIQRKEVVIVSLALLVIKITAT